MTILLFLLLLFSCDNQKGSESLKAEIDVKELFRLRGCTDCHDTERPLAGPSFFEISERYRNRDTRSLLKSLLSGSCGKWKARMECMPPQRIEEEEARKMIDWILHLKTKKPPTPSS